MKPNVDYANGVELSGKRTEDAIAVLLDSLRVTIGGIAIAPRGRLVARVRYEPDWTPGARPWRARWWWPLLGFAIVGLVRLVRRWERSW